MRLPMLSEGLPFRILWTLGVVEVGEPIGLGIDHVDLALGHPGYVEIAAVEVDADDRVSLHSVTVSEDADTPVSAAA